MDLSRRSYLTLLILNLVQEQKAAYGYQIAQLVEEQSQGQYKLKEGTLYPLFHHLEKNGILKGDWRANLDGGPPRKYFQLTQDGQRLLEKEKQTLLWFTHLLFGAGEASG